MLNYRKYNHNRRAYLLRRFSFSHLERFEPIGPLQLLLPEPLPLGFLLHRILSPGYFLSEMPSVK